MKMKHLLVYLSLLGLVQVGLFASGSAWVNEMLDPKDGADVMSVWMMLTLMAFIATVALYTKLFSDTFKK